MRSENTFVSTFLPAPVQEITLNSAYIVGILFIILAGLFVIDAVQWAFDVLRYDNPEPGLGGSTSDREIRIEVGNHESIQVEKDQTMRQKQMSNWLVQNHEMLSKMDSELERAYQHLAVGVGILFVALLFLMFSELTMFGSVALVMILFTFGGAQKMKSLLFSLYSILATNWSKHSGETTWNRIRSTIGSVKVGDEMKGDKAGLALFILLLGYFQVSLTTIMFLIWIPVPVSEYGAVMILF